MITYLLPKPWRQKHLSLSFSLTHSADKKNSVWPEDKLNYLVMQSFIYLFIY